MITVLKSMTFLQGKKDAVEKECYAIMGMEMNLNSKQDLSTAIYFALGMENLNNNVSDEALYYLLKKHNHPFIEKVLEYRRYSDAIEILKNTISK
jgi:DNA polymerase I-like protein with 3'-5' exonuclease and polymerase domains